MNWLFCNKCSLKFTPNIKFFLSECGHILCQKCTKNIVQIKHCIVCNKPTAFMELSKNMDPTTQMFFWPLENIFEQAVKVYNFQSMHRGLFLQSLTKKYTFAKKECIGYYNANKKLQKEVQMLREMLKSIGYNPPPFTTSTPTGKSDHTYDHNLSNLSSIRFTPSAGQVPGNAQRQAYSEGYADKNRACQQMYPQVPGSASSSNHDPSPAQRVPKGYPTPVHKDHSMQNPISHTPMFMDKYRNKSGYPSVGYPRK